MYLPYEFFSINNHEMPTAIMDTVLRAGNTSMIRQDSCHHRAYILQGCVSTQRWDRYAIIHFLTYYKCQTKSVHHFSLTSLCVSASSLLLPSAKIQFSSKTYHEPRVFSHWYYCFYFSHYWEKSELSFKNNNTLLLKLLTNASKA